MRQNRAKVIRRGILEAINKCNRIPNKDHYIRIINNALLQDYQKGKLNQEQAEEVHNLEQKIQEILTINQPKQ